VKIPVEIHAQGKNWMKNLDRRAFLGGAAALAASPALAQTGSVSGNVDVAIVGAGAAGIAAARRVAAAGGSYMLLEANNRIGGRIWSGQGTLGVAHDRGAHRISASGRNPLVAIGRLAGLKLSQPAPFRRLYVGGREARDSEYDNFTAARHRASRAIVAAGEAGQDLAAARTLPDLADWRGTVSFVLGPFATSKDLEEISTVDFARIDDQSEQLVCAGGLGRLISAAADSLRVELSAPVTRIDARGRGSITVETERGSVRADAVVVTASTNVLNSGTIRFEPGLPKRTADALAGLTLGTRDRLMFELFGNPFDFADDQRVIFKSNDGRTIGLTGRAGGTHLAHADFCGLFGLEVANAGEGAMRDFVIETLVSHFGAESKKFLGKSEAVRWSRERWVQGAGSVASPGSGNNRRALGEPVHDRIFLAGEALHENWWGTVAGAWISGERAADAALRVANPSGAAAERKGVPRRKQ
jgi:monoamine oxidase